MPHHRNGVRVSVQALLQDDEACTWHKRRGLARRGSCDESWRSSSTRACGLAHWTGQRRLLRLGGSGGRVAREGSQGRFGGGRLALLALLRRGRRGSGPRVGRDLRRRRQGVAPKRRHPRGDWRTRKSTYEKEQKNQRAYGRYRFRRGLRPPRAAVPARPRRQGRSTPKPPSARSCLPCREWARRPPLREGGSRPRSKTRPHDGRGLPSGPSAGQPLGSPPARGLRPRSPPGGDA